MGRLLIIDGHAYAYRAFFAIKSLRSPEGKPVNAIFGFVNMLAKMVEALRPQYLTVIWDGGLSQERLERLPEYKAQRPATPDDLKVQFDEIERYLQAARIHFSCRDGVEADDDIASLARVAEQSGLEVVIASADKDFMQLVSERIGLLNPNDKTNEIWHREKVREKTGVDPGQVVDWLALMGDAVDNIPGVPGVGPKTATNLLGQFGSVKGLYQRLPEVASAGLRNRLAAAENLVYSNMVMVRLRDDLDCGITPVQCRVREPDQEKLRELYRGWGFNRLLARLEQPVEARQAELI